ncbi:MAG TPA: NYN domain-containing protein [Ktedonobacterales bacterium]
MADEIALFIDFENIRYSLLNVQHREPDPQELIAMARRFGTVMVARAYADWTRQPEFFKGSLTAAMIDRVDCPAKVRDRYRQNGNGYGPGSGFGYSSGYQQHAPYQHEIEAPEREYDEREDGEGGEGGEDGEEIAGTDHEHDVPRDDEQAGDAAYDQQHEDGGAEVEGQDDGEDDGEDEHTGNTGDANPPEFAQPAPFYEDRRPRFDGGYPPYANQQGIYTQSTVDLNMLMDIIETVFDRPSISTYILMSGDRDFTRIAARLKLRLNKRVIVIGVPGSVSRDLIAAAEQYLPLGYNGPLPTPGYHHGPPMPQFAPPMGPVEPDEPGFIQFLDYIDRRWSWRTIIGVSNFIGDPFNPKNRFRGRLTRDSARDLLRACLDDGILLMTSDPTGGENLRLNRNHPAVETVLNEAPMR